MVQGKLPTGQEIAGKRLNILSGHGVDKQFKTEVAAMSKLQQRDLVKLLGYSIHGEDRILVYEYLPNGSLDSFIFGEINQLDTYFAQYGFAFYSLVLYRLAIEKKMKTKDRISMFSYLWLIYL